MGGDCEAGSVWQCRLTLPLPSPQSLAVAMKGPPKAVAIAVAVAVASIRPNTCVIQKTPLPSIMPGLALQPELAYLSSETLQQQPFFTERLLLDMPAIDVSTDLPCIFVPTRIQHSTLAVRNTPSTTKACMYRDVQNIRVFLGNLVEIAGTTDRNFLHVLV